MNSVKLYGKDGYYAVDGDGAMTYYGDLNKPYFSSKYNCWCVSTPEQSRQCIELEALNREFWGKGDHARNSLISILR